jgi:hypothetical protein
MKLILCALMFITSAAAQQLQFASLGDFKLESGETLSDCRIGYRTFGTLNSSKSNVVLIPTWAGGTTEQLISSVGPDGLVDPAKYYVILVDALSNAVSSSPSNSKLQPRMQFPKITIRDMVNPASAPDAGAAHSPRARRHGHLHGRHADVPVDGCVSQFHGCGDSHCGLAETRSL